jgi:hypothetical protein
MQTHKLLAATAVGILFSFLSFGQTTTEPQTVPEVPKQVVEVQAAPSTQVKTDSEKMETLFSGMTKGGTKKVKYLGISGGSQFQYGMLAGQFTHMAGGTALLHINKKWGVGMAGYSTIDNSFAPTAINAAKLLNLSSSYGGFLLEYTPKPNAKIHVSFPLLIGGGRANVDSVNSTKNQKYSFGRNGGKDGKNEVNGRGNNGAGVYFPVIQPGINIEANLFRYARVFAGASYRIVPSVTKEATTTTTALLPTPTANQLSGLNLTAGVRIGIFDYNLDRPKKVRTRSPRSSIDENNNSNNNRRGFWGIGRRGRN